MTAPYIPPPDQQTVMQTLLGLVGRPQPQAQPRLSVLEQLHDYIGSLHRVVADATATASPAAQMQQTGITPQQREGYMPGLSEALFKYVTPNNYSQLDIAKNRVTQDMQSLIGRGPGPSPAREQLPLPQEDSWRLYLGMPQQGREFEVAPFAPTTAKGDGAQYLRIRDFLPRYIAQQAERAQTRPEIVLRNLVDDVRLSGGKLPMSDNNFSLDKTHAFYGVMQNFQVSHGHDEVGPYIAYYDKWDLAAPGAQHIGKPYDLYDRMYYDPKTFRPIPESEVLAKKAGLDLKVKK